MEVSMDTSPGLPHPQSQQTLSTSTSTSPAPAAPGSPSPSPRKRSLQDPNGDNQENNDPEMTAPARENDPSTTRKDSVEMKDADKPAATTAEESPTEPERMVRVEIPLSSIPTPNMNEQVPPSTPQQSTTTNAPAAKKRKLSPSSKEAKQQEKEARDRQRADEKVKKEEEKARKEEEKAKKEEEKKAKEEEKKKKELEREEEKKKRDAEKEEKKRVKDEERAVKEEEKRKREEEKSKKERAQTKLNAFFAKPKASAESSNPVPSGSPKKNVSDGAAANEGSSEVVSDYQRAFPDFFLQSHTKVAPPHRFERDSEALEVMRQRVDECLRSDPQEPLVFRPSELFRMMPYKRRRGRQAASVKDILLQIQNMGSNGDGRGTAAATTAVAQPGNRPQDQLKKIRMKSLKFGEDVRPPYQGTYTRKVPESSAYKLSRNPYRRELPGTSYDYDSEAEWEEPEEGEELDSEEEEEGSEDGDDDMEGFLDDEEDQPAVDGKRRLIVGDLEPQSTGLRWQETAAVDEELQMYQIQTISDSVTFPIDPFSTIYWQKPKPDATPASNGAPTPGGSNSTNATAEGSNGGQGNALTLLGSGTGKTKGRSFPPEQLAEFKDVVDGSDLTKMGLVEILKKKFPKVSKEVLKETLNSVATRVGSKEAEKKWVCR